MGTYGYLIVAAVVVVVWIMMHPRGLTDEASARRHLERGARVIDVRSPEEHNQGHLEGVMNVPLPELASRIGTVAPDKSQVLLLHCRSGARSSVAERRLRALGYKEVHNLGSYARAEKILAGSGYSPHPVAR
ncbi:MAG TPA: rhodanese-like domain-containing protein [Verrucomicrobiota bacterium]|nr:rhodanese-like domain-containing protein [Verrucomicrobiota bacterium]HNU51012.1 rhodanese-like domain-containing protein [Verrucomicrobiota bacterium]